MTVLATGLGLDVSEFSEQCELEFDFNGYEPNLFSLFCSL